MKPSPATRAAGSQGGPRQYLNKPAEWYKSDEAKRVADIVLTWQSSLGGWPKNLDTTASPSTQPADKLHGTFDNNATFDELRLMAKMFNATQNPAYRQAFERGMDLIFVSQYPTGGWPQSYPPDKSYHRYITFNDGSMARLLFFVKETLESPDYAFLDAGRKSKAQSAFERGVDCILKCQIKVNGKLTAWCAQHDEIDYSPREGRKFELASISGNESVGIIHLLMALPKPTPQQIAAVDAAVAWLDSVKIPGIRTEDRDTPGGEFKKERFVVKDPSAPPMWARFYEIGTDKPIFCGRDGVKKYDLAEIDHERRNGYRWLSYWPQNLIATEYPAWKAQHPTP
jgi:PelA/Pel-15E family pectate lyase